MKLPNKYGSAYKLKGKRRRPWAARKTIGWKDVPEKKRSYPIYHFIGYYETRAEALQALAEYNRAPYALTKQMTLEELHDAWASFHAEKASASTMKAYKKVWPICSQLAGISVSSIRPAQLQHIAEASGKNRPTLHLWKAMLGQMFEYAVRHGLAQKDLLDAIRAIDISFAGNPNQKKHERFSAEEIQLLWDVLPSYPDAGFALLLIYTGCRISELLALAPEDVHLEERFFQVRTSKTAAGIRSVPIAEKIVAFAGRWKDDRFGFPHDGSYTSVRAKLWTPLMDALDLEHTLHDTRHTCISLLAEAGVDARIIKQIVGHSGADVTSKVYTHISIDVMREAINKI